MRKRLLLAGVAAMFICASAFAMCGVCGSDGASKEKEQHMFAHVSSEAAVVNGVKQITYDQFMKIRSSGEKYKLLDVRPAASYNVYHIDGAASFPLETINKASAEKLLAKNDNIVVYCGSFECGASTEAAKTLSELGYNVLDYKGGIKEWQEKSGK